MRRDIIRFILSPGTALLALAFLYVVVRLLTCDADS